MEIGIISDTHGEIPDRVFDEFSGLDQIWHAGDIGDSHILHTLATLAPVTAVHGNMDKFPILSEYPEYHTFNLLNKTLLLTHKLIDRNFRPLVNFDKFSVNDFDVVVFGHTHIPLIHTAKSLLYFNPGSASEPRVGKNVSVGKLAIKKNGKIIPEIVYL